MTSFVLGWRDSLRSRSSWRELFLGMEQGCGVVAACLWADIGLDGPW